MNIPSYVVTFPATTARKNVLRDSDRSYTAQPVQICERAIYVLEQKKNKQKNNNIYFHLKITKFYSREKLNYWPGSITLMFQVFKNLAIPTFLALNLL